VTEHEWGLWVDTPDTLGWFGFAAGQIFIPMRFPEDEVKERAAASGPGWTPRIVPEDERELPWNEAEHRKRMRRP
jgi:hypothetical protein